jgi:hypothetical protein
MQSVKYVRSSGNEEVCTMLTCARTACYYCTECCTIERRNKTSPNGHKAILDEVQHSILAIHGAYNTSQSNMYFLQCNTYGKTSIRSTYAVRMQLQRAARIQMLPCACSYSPSPSPHQFGAARHTHTCMGKISKTWSWSYVPPCLLQ